MSELIVVRHGQASFGEGSYDKLSERGIEQVRLLARHWQDLGEEFDCIYSGTLRRQQETANELLPLVKGCPDKPLLHTSLNEYNSEPLLQIYLRDHLADEGFDPTPTWPVNDPRLFQQLFEAATSRWIRNELEPGEQELAFEHWSSFKSRVHGVLDEIMSQHSAGSRVLISTSGGVIAMALQRVLNFSDEHVIATNWMVHNSSVTRIKYGNGKISLTQFNGLSHLEKDGLQQLVTYR